MYGHLKKIVLVSVRVHEVGGGERKWLLIQAPHFILLTTNKILSGSFNLLKTIRETVRALQKEEKTRKTIQTDIDIQY